jgi:hypothetical protein
MRWTPTSVVMRQLDAIYSVAPTTR